MNYEQFHAEYAALSARVADRVAANKRLAACRELRAEINRLLLKNPQRDKNFALCAALLVGDRLGYPTLEHGGEDILRG